MNEENQPASSDQKIEGLLEMNLKAMEGIRADVASIKKYFRLRAIMTVVWIIIVVAPTILAIIYIPTFIKSYIGTDLLKILNI